MSSKELKNIAASIRQRLLNIARADKRPFAELLQYYAMERVLYRLSQSQHANSFILKGALLLRVWNSLENRSTKDIDMLGKTSNNESAIIAQFKEVLQLDIEPDGLYFDLQTIHTEPITAEADYKGTRVLFQAFLDTARISIQIDIGFGDVVYPKPQIAEIPTILNSPVPRLLCYSRESAIAEKFNAMIQHGELNSRIKDFYDIWLLSRQFNFDGTVLAKAITLTFNNRNTDMPSRIVAFSNEFASDKQAQWIAFRKRLNLENSPVEFNEIITATRAFLAPVASAILTDEAFTQNWIAPGAWQNRYQL